MIRTQPARQEPAAPARAFTRNRGLGKMRSVNADLTDRWLVQRIRAGDASAWEECIARYEGRLLAFVNSRLRNPAASEDVVQETFLGFLVSLPNYDERTPLESFLFSIAAHKLTDVLRREGRRPTLPLRPADAQSGILEPAGRDRRASSLVRSADRRAVEETLLADALRSLIVQWLEQGEYERLKCMELLFVLGWANKDVARRLGISEQAVANHKHFVVAKLASAIREQCGRDTALLDELGLR